MNNKIFLKNTKWGGKNRKPTTTIRLNPRPRGQNEIFPALIEGYEKYRPPPTHHCYRRRHCR